MREECDSWRGVAVDAQLHLEVVRIGDLVRRHDPRPERAERVDRLAEREHARAHLAALDVARGDVVEDHVAADVVGRLLGREPLAGLLQDRRRARARSRAPRSCARGRSPGRPGRRARRRSGRRRSRARSRAPSRPACSPPRARGSCPRCGRTSWARSAAAASPRRAARARPLSSAPPRSKYSRIVGTSSSGDLVADDMPDGHPGVGVLKGHKLHVLSPSCPQMRSAARA